MLYDVVLVWPGSCNNVAPEHAYHSILSTQNVATHGIWVAKRAQHVVSNNVAIVWPELAKLGLQCWDMLC